jgi:nucleolar protein 9
MLSIPGPATSLLQESILALPAPTLLQLACTTSTSHILQSALTTTPSNLSFRRKLTNKFLQSPSQSGSIPEPIDHSPQNPILTLALDKAGSHVLDALYTGTTNLMMLKERICSILLSHEAQLREDFVGRVVLRNWMVELFGRRRSEWIRRVKASEGTTGAVKDGVVVTSLDERANSGGLRGVRGGNSNSVKNNTGLKHSKQPTVTKAV